MLRKHFMHDEAQWYYWCMNTTFTFIFELRTIFTPGSSLAQTFVWDCPTCSPPVVTTCLTVIASWYIQPYCHTLCYNHMLKPWGWGWVWVWCSVVGGWDLWTLTWRLHNESTMIILGTLCDCFGYYCDSKWTFLLFHQLVISESVLKASSVRNFTPLCFFRFKVNPNPHWTASEWDTEVCLVPSSPWWELRAPGVCIVDWWQDFTDRWALPQSALACMTPWSSSTPGGQNVCFSVYYNVIAIVIFHCRLFLTRRLHF